MIQLLQVTVCDQQRERKTYRVFTYESYQTFTNEKIDLPDIDKVPKCSVSLTMPQIMYCIRLYLTGQPFCMFGPFK